MPNLKKLIKMKTIKYIGQLLLMVFGIVVMTISMYFLGAALNII